MLVMDRLVLFENATGNQPLRDQHKAAHHAYLLEHRNAIRMAGQCETGTLRSSAAPSGWSKRITVMSRAN